MNITCCHFRYCPHRLLLPQKAESPLRHFAEVVDVLARRPQLQERFTWRNLQSRADGLGARGALVIVRIYLCLSMRNHLGGDSEVLLPRPVWDVWVDGTEAGQAWKLLMEGDAQE